MRAGEMTYAALREDIAEWRLAPGTVLAEVAQSDRRVYLTPPCGERLAGSTRKDQRRRQAGAAK